MQTAASVKTFISRERDESASGAVHSVGALNRLVFPAAGRLNGPELILSPITRGALEGEIVSARRPQRARDRNRIARANKWGAVATSTNTASNATKTVGQEWIRLACKDQDLEGAGKREWSRILRISDRSAPRVYG